MKTLKHLISAIDLTNLNPSSGEDEILRLCVEAEECEIGGICVPPNFVKFCQRHLLRAKSKIKLATVISFPDGWEISRVKAEAARRMVGEGARCVDMVSNLSASSHNLWRMFRTDIEQVVRAATPAEVRVIIETGLLDTNEKITRACQEVKAAGAHCVKTSTGRFRDANGKVLGATVNHVNLMRLVVGADFQIKAAGNIRTLEDCWALLNAGADILGTSSGAQIAKEAHKAMAA